jgi:ornithine cyclodeaminase/alanine dehydrogenase-like protein (mu-crystallin family)
MTARRTLMYLSEQDTIRAGVLDTARCIDVCEDVFRLLDAGDYLMGGSNGNSHGLGLPFPSTSPFPNMPVAGPDRRFVTMPAYVGGRYDICGNKWYGSNPANASRGLPRSVLTLLLNDKDTGEPVCLMSANLLSAARTGAIPAVAARHFAPRSATTLAVLGSGAINKACVTAILTERPDITHVACFDILPDVARSFAAWVTQTHSVAAAGVASVQDAVADADIVTVAASRLAPLEVRASWFTPDATILLTGPMSADNELWLGSWMVYDHIGLHESYVAEALASPDRAAYYRGVIGGPLYSLIDDGELPALARSTDLGDVITGRVPARPDRRGRVVFIACGMAVFDVAWGTQVYHQAQLAGVGQELDLWGTSDLVGT